MAESSYPWAGTILGDCGPYTDDQWSEWWRLTNVDDASKQGVIYVPAGTMLAVNQLGGTSFEMGPGDALVYGRRYNNSTAKGFSVSIPGSGSYYYTAVLRCDWALQTIRFVLLGPDVSDYPSVTQSVGTTWEIEIARIRVTSAPAYTLTDKRVYIGKSPILYRVGGSSTNWNTQGATAYEVISPKMQVGTARIPSGASHVHVFFPLQYDNGLPIVFPSQLTAAEDHHIIVSAITQLEFTIQTHDNTNVTADTDIAWVSIGPQ